MTDFDLGRTFDGAVCAWAGTSDRGARYLVQLQLGADRRSSQWETEKLRVTWATERLDPEAGRQQQRSRIEILSGERAGEIVEELHKMTLWAPEAWAATVRASPFAETAVFDGAPGYGPARSLPG